MAYVRPVSIQCALVTKTGENMEKSVMSSLFWMPEAQRKIPGGNFGCSYAPVSQNPSNNIFPPQKPYGHGRTCAASSAIITTQYTITHYALCRHSNIICLHSSVTQCIEYAIQTGPAVVVTNHIPMDSICLCFNQTFY